MSKKPPVVKIGRIIIRTPEEQAEEAARAIKALWARNKATNKSKLPVKGNRPGNYCPGAHFVRPGADDALEIPSRYGDSLHFRDGRCTDMTGNPLPSYSTPNQ